MAGRKAFCLTSSRQHATWGPRPSRSAGAGPQAAVLAGHGHRAETRLLLNVGWDVGPGWTSGAQKGAEGERGEVGLGDGPRERRVVCTHASTRSRWVGSVWTACDQRRSRVELRSLHAELRSQLWRHSGQVTYLLWAQAPPLPEPRGAGQTGGTPGEAGLHTPWGQLWASVCSGSA